ncbi:uncharacterized protein LOC141713757 [Apium graveolens]|uniref:uncharacterized protein LOC141713757 n=1 Tax=Apium graveolens TaxID=4045 RepID=UPI003D79A30E
MVEETYVVKKLLRAVPAKFLQIASTIEPFGDLEAMSVEEIVGSLKAHEERLKGPDDNNLNQQLLLTEEEWAKREGNEKKLLLTRDEWLKRTNKNGECRKPKRDREQKGEANLAQINDDEPALLVAEFEQNTRGTVMLHASDSRAVTNVGKEIEAKIEANMWYLDNGASNHMTGHRGKFAELDEGVIGQVKFGDGSMVHIRG